MKKTFNLFLVMMVAMVGFTFTSCSDDDTPKGATVEEAVGKYAGKMMYDKSATELNIELKNDSVCFEKFPYEPMVIAILGEEGAKPIISQIGTLKYNVSYTAAMNAANDSVFITLKPEPLKITLGTALSIEVVINAANKGAYAVKDKNLKFDLTAADVKVGAGSFPGWAPISLAFDMKKK